MTTDFRDLSDLSGENKTTQGCVGPTSVRADWAFPRQLHVSHRFPQSAGFILAYSPLTPARLLCLSSASFLHFCPVTARPSPSLPSLSPLLHLNISPSLRRRKKSPPRIPTRLLLAHLIRKLLLIPSHFISFVPGQTTPTPTPPPRI